MTRKKALDPSLDQPDPVPAQQGQNHHSRPATIEDVLNRIDGLHKVGQSDRKVITLAVLELKTNVTDAFKRVHERLDHFMRSIDAVQALLQEHAKDLTAHSHDITALKGALSDHDKRLMRLEARRNARKNAARGV